ncbi:MAG: sigma-70 family RNA polymerase sigma factor [Bacteroidetes bacterium]|nr:sigma-70 family RNA polymerase sigma factor [Bacteroidota bacterium]
MRSEARELDYLDEINQSGQDEEFYSKRIQYENIDSPELKSNKNYKNNSEEEKYKLFNAYLKDISKEKLLSPDEVVEVSAKIRSFENKSEGIGREINRLRSIVSVRQDIDEFEHIRILKVLQKICVENISKLRQKLARANLRLVINIAMRYVNRGVPLTDIVQEGNLGLMKAVEKFDYTMGFRFSTYASWWIQQSIVRGILNQKRTIRVPIHILEKSKDVSRHYKSLAQKLGRKPTPEEVSKVAGISKEGVEQLFKNDERVLSLNNPISSDNDATFIDFIEDNDTPSPDSSAIKSSIADLIHEALTILNEREKEIIEMRFGIGDYSPHTLDEIAKGYGRFLTWLDFEGLLDLDACPEDRVSPGNVAKYVEHLQGLNASLTVLTRIEELTLAIKVMAPKYDRTYLKRLQSVLRAKVTPARDNRARVQHAGELRNLGLSLIHTARNSGSTPLQKAIDYLKEKGVQDD